MRTGCGYTTVEEAFAQARQEIRGEQISMIGVQADSNPQTTAVTGDPASSWNASPAPINQPNDLARETLR